MRTRAGSSSNRKSASALASSVLPVPVGPRNRNEPVGRFGSLMPARERRTASLTAVSAARWVDVGARGLGGGLDLRLQRRDPAVLDLAGLLQVALAQQPLGLDAQL